MYNYLEKYLNPLHASSIIKRHRTIIPIITINIITTKPLVTGVDSLHFVGKRLKPVFIVILILYLFFNTYSCIYCNNLFRVSEKRVEVHFKYLRCKIT